MLYSVQITEHAVGGRAETNVVGVFDTPTAAKIAFYYAFLRTCDKYGIDKSLTDSTQVDTDCSFYNEGKEFSIDILENDEVSSEVFGEITELELNKMNLEFLRG